MSCGSSDRNPPEATLRNVFAKFVTEAHETKPLADMTEEDVPFLGYCLANAVLYLRLITGGKDHDLSLHIPHVVR
jgi:hypothetical protein